MLRQLSIHLAKISTGGCSFFSTLVGVIASSVTGRGRFAGVLGTGVVLHLSRRDMTIDGATASGSAICCGEGIK